MDVLGLDLGTNSIGWGIVNEKDQLIKKCGVYIFPEGVKKEKGVESSKAAERTEFRSARRLKFRRKLRKYETLKVLIINKMCPLTMEELEEWKKEKVYPKSKDFINWYRTDENKNWEPYFLRKKCVEQKAEKYEIGRALYHLAQRRGFLSNRKETTKESDGKVKGQIDELTTAKGNLTLGQYFFELKKTGKKVRGKYTSRKIHYEEEFNKICEVQKISNELRNELYNAIFYQRKLKSQKFLVGKCSFETDKPRCPISHFEFEEFRMLSFINSIKVARNQNEEDKQDFSFLTEAEKEVIKPLFYRVSKPSFNFVDISKKLMGKNDDWVFNYRNDANVAACPVSTGLKNVFGNDWVNTSINNYDIWDIWHVLFDFDDDEKLHEFAVNKLHLNSDQVNKFCDINLQQGYANLSLKAIRKINVFLRKGYIYSTAVFLANIPTMIGKEKFQNSAEEIETKIKTIQKELKEKNTIRAITNLCIEKIFKDEKHNFHAEEWDNSIVENQIFDFYGKKKWAEVELEKQNLIVKEINEKVNETLKIAVTKNAQDYKYAMLRTDDLIMEYLSSKGFEIKKNTKLYHPSETEFLFEQPKIINGKQLLGSPRTPSIKNPVVMRALFQLKKLINYMLENDIINSETRINIELANEVNDKNWRKAIEDYQKENEKKNEEYRKRIIETCSDAGIHIIPTDSDIKKYRLWKEQKETCPYTGKTINITDLFGPNPQFDFEHTIPRSLSYDDSLENLTLCDIEFNRKIKKQHIPSELSNFAEINARFQSFYEEKIEALLGIIEKNKTRSGYIDPAVKDLRIVKRHKAKLELDYYKGKLKRFTALEVTAGFKHSQLNDTRIITKFALSYLKSIFNYVQPVNGSMTDLFKKQWGLLNETENKNRSNYRHHAVDALTIACINRTKFNLLCEIIRKSSTGTHLKFDKPWETFDKDVFNAVEYIIPKHFVDDNSLRQTKKVLKDRYGKTILKNGKKVFIQGATARGSLHKDTFYGCILTPPEKDVPSQKIFVQRISCNNLKIDTIEKIVDKKIRDICFSNLDKKIQTIENIQEKGILLPPNSNSISLYVKKIRVKAKPTSPIVLKKHDNVINDNFKDYKQNYYVVNDENYFIALYRGKNSKGQTISDYLVSNLLDSIKNKQKGNKLYPEFITKKESTLNLYKVLKIGMTIILKQSEDENLAILSQDKIWERIYSIIGINADGRIKLTHISIADPWKFIPCKDVTIYEDFRLMSVNQLAISIEKEDFTISPTGELLINSDIT